MTKIKQQQCLKEKSILFSTNMVQAIIDGRKTQTRRIAKTDKPPYRAGDILYIRETWAQSPSGDYLYKAHSMYKGMDDADFSFSWKPAIHMSKAAARIFLEVVNIRKEKLQDITEEDAKAEGVELCSPLDLKQMPLSLITSLPNGSKVLKKTFRAGFYKIWQEINEKNMDAQWNNNPTVWVIEFRKKEDKLFE